MTLLSFVIPCYRSEKTISTVVQEIRETVQSRAGYDYEIILVIDCSPDNVFEVAAQLAKADPRVKCIELAKNFGQHGAIMTGLRYTKGEVIICLDDDGQTPASELFTLVDCLNEGHDVVFAKYPQKKHSLFRNFGSKINDLMACSLINKPKDLSLMSYFCCKRFVVDELVRYHNPYPYISGLLLRTTKNIVNVDIPHRERIEGASGYTFGKLLALWINGFTAFSVKPLRVATAGGFIFALVGFLYGLYTIINKLFIHPEAPLGYSSLMAALLFLSGIIMVILGLIGEYVGRIYICLSDAPQAVIRTKINLEDSPNEE